MRNFRSHASPLKGGAPHTPLDVLQELTSGCSHVTDASQVYRQCVPALHAVVQVVVCWLAVPDIQPAPQQWVVDHVHRGQGPGGPEAVHQDWKLLCAIKISGAREYHLCHFTWHRNHSGCALTVSYTTYWTPSFIASISVYPIN